MRNLDNPFALAVGIAGTRPSEAIALAPAGLELPGDGLGLAILARLKQRGSIATTPTSPCTATAT